MKLHRAVRAKSYVKTDCCELPRRFFLFTLFLVGSEILSV